MIVRPATEADVAALADIYAHHVAHGTASFEEVAPTADDMAQRLRAVLSRGLPWMVAEENGRVLGYAYAGPYHSRSAYRYTVEDSVYVAPSAMRRGVGRALLQRVLEECAAMGLRRMVALIGDSANTGSVRLHEALGFQPVGTLPAVGYKHGRWLDVVLMHKALNGGDGDDAADIS
jgi:phosphinothricin acetyltransferase